MESEVKIALMQFSARKGLNFKTENINKYTLNSKAPVSIALEVFDATANKTGTINFKYAEIAAALMGYCMNLKIPLPKAGKKAVFAKDGNLFLNIKIQ